MKTCPCYVYSTWTETDPPNHGCSFAKVSAKLEPKINQHLAGGCRSVQVFNRFRSSLETALSSLSHFFNKSFTVPRSLLHLLCFYLLPSSVLVIPSFLHLSSSLLHFPPSMSLLFISFLPSLPLISHPLAISPPFCPFFLSHDRRRWTLDRRCRLCSIAWPTTPTWRRAPRSTRRPRASARRRKPARYIRPCVTCKHTL